MKKKNEFTLWAARDLSTHSEIHVYPLKPAWWASGTYRYWLGVGGNFVLRSTTLGLRPGEGPVKLLCRVVRPKKRRVVQ